MFQEYLNYAVNNLGWDKDKFMITFGHILTRGEFEKISNDYNNANNLKKAPIDEVPACACRYTSWSCLFGDECLNQNNCQVTFNGCGFLWLFSCGGKCQ